MTENDWNILNYYASMTKTCLKMLKVFCSTLLRWHTAGWHVRHWAGLLGAWFDVGNSAGKTGTSPPWLVRNRHNLSQLHNIHNLKVCPWFWFCSNFRAFYEQQHLRRACQGVIRIHKISNMFQLHPIATYRHHFLKLFILQFSSFFSIIRTLDFTISRYFEVSAKKLLLPMTWKIRSALDQLWVSQASTHRLQPCSSSFLMFSQFFLLFPVFVSIVLIHVDSHIFSECQFVAAQMKRFQVGVKTLRVVQQWPLFC